MIADMKRDVSLTSTDVHNPAQGLYECCAAAPRQRRHFIRLRAKRGLASLLHHQRVEPGGDDEDAKPFPNGLFTTTSPFLYSASSSRLPVRLALPSRRVLASGGHDRSHRQRTFGIGHQR